MNHNFSYGETEIEDRNAPKAKNFILSAPRSAKQKKILSRIECQPDVLYRNGRPGHLTASTLIIDPENLNILLLYHTKLKRWLQPGGHADGDENLARVALREAIEETGISTLTLVEHAIDLDIHLVDLPDEGLHEHYDIRFLALASSSSRIVKNHESEGLIWVSQENLAALDGEHDLGPLVQKGVACLQGLITKNSFDSDINCK